MHLQVLHVLYITKHNHPTARPTCTWYGFYGANSLMPIYLWSVLEGNVKL